MAATNQAKDLKRLTLKIGKFQQAVESLGVDRVADKIGRSAFSSFTCAADALTRKQSLAIVSNFVGAAQERCAEHLKLQPDEDVYHVLASMKKPTV